MYVIYFEEMLFILYLFGICDVCSRLGCIRNHLSYLHIDIIRITLPIFLPLLTFNRLKSETKSLFPKHKTFETFILAEIAPQRRTPQELVDPEGRYSLTLPVLILRQFMLF